MPTLIVKNDRLPIEFGGCPILGETHVVKNASAMPFWKALPWRLGFNRSVDFSRKTCTKPKGTWKLVYHRIGWWEHLQEGPILGGKNPWVSCRCSPLLPFAVASARPCRWNSLLLWSRTSFRRGRTAGTVFMVEDFLTDLPSSKVPSGKLT